MTTDQQRRDQEARAVLASPDPLRAVAAILLERDQLRAALDRRHEYRLTTAEAAGLLRVSARTVGKFVMAGVLRAGKIPGVGYRFSEADIDQLRNP